MVWKLQYWFKPGKTGWSKTDHMLAVDDIKNFNEKTHAHFIGRITFQDEAPDSNKRKEGEDSPTPVKKITVEPHVIPNRGPYSYSQPKK